MSMNKTYLITMDFKQIDSKSSFMDAKYFNLKHLDVVKILSTQKDINTPHGITNDTLINCEFVDTGIRFSTHFPWLFAENTDENRIKIIQIHNIDVELSRLQKIRSNLMDDIKVSDLVRKGK